MQQGTGHGDDSERDAPAPWPPEGFAVDRASEVPLGVQLSWAIRAHVDDGTLQPGARLPALRDLAGALAVNVNTVRAVYARLESEGLIESRHGSGTFVSAAARPRSRVGPIAARAAQAARRANVDPRQVASALYVQSSSLSSHRSQAARRADLRAEIAALDRTLSEMEAEHPLIAGQLRRRQQADNDARSAPRLPGAAELEHTRQELLRRLIEMQAAIDVIGSEPAEGRGADAGQAVQQGARKKPAPRPGRPATRAAPAGA